MDHVISTRPGMTERSLRTLQGLASRIRAAAARRRRIAQIEYELYAHDDRGLADMGIARCDIPRIAREA